MILKKYGTDGKKHVAQLAACCDAGHVMNTTLTTTTAAETPSADNMLSIGDVVRLANDNAKTRTLGIIKSIRSGSALFPGWHYDIAWTGRAELERAVPAHLITLAAI